MDATDLRRPLELSAGLAIGIGLVVLATGDWPRFGFLLGIGLVPITIIAFERIDGPLEARTARIGAIVVGGGLVGAALWLAA
ncbi:hypothetical protein HTZ84_08955 [Haloterrigena sp. SYSU A558-1]|uniref:Uncharacterized protein n=1 Tax=Haloterrigena gelatinilytica TaxID=2741724 RepID=A0ABX2LDL3_9EURY|nr:hypothetical protein [Haloterrigena gelatinilytica]NUC72438.1 hypothetical protein [Haloterrigena gelatinilytica]